MIDIAHVLADERTNPRGSNLSYQVCSEYQASIQSHYHIQTAPLISSRNLSTQLRNSGGNSRWRKRRGLFAVAFGLGRFSATHEIFSSAITIPARVFSLGANSAATGNPRAHASTSPLVRTGQPARSHRLTELLFNKRFSLCVPWCPTGCNLSPGRQFRSTKGDRSASRSSTESL